MKNLVLLVLLAAFGLAQDALPGRIKLCLDLTCSVKPGQGRYLYKVVTPEGKEYVFPRDKRDGYNGKVTYKINGDTITVFRDGKELFTRPLITE